MVTEFAPAKINLSLHVTGRRADGYHLLDSLVCFATVGDRVTVAPSDDLSLAIIGPQGAGLSPDAGNLALRAARAFAGGRGAAIVLDKHLPLASGIGGGSTDAAATLRALAALWDMALPDAAAILGLGADVPVCLAPRGVRMTGVGEVIGGVALPHGWLVLVNPAVAVATPDVFRGLVVTGNDPMPAVLPAFPDVIALSQFLNTMRNDLELPAVAIAPAIARAKSALAAQRGCLFARMSGSGATCFGLFATADAAHHAASAIGAAQPDWWVEHGRMIV
jgi:4-diphosphocytidyl-2-C-methyl-D-erythritol kinase